MTLAHGGVYGAIVELAVVVLVAVFFFAAWLRTRDGDDEES